MALTVLPLVACKAKPHDERFVEPGSSRPYRVVSPRATGDGEPPGRPVLFSLHPYQTAPEAIVDHFELIRHAVEERGFLLVVPEGQKDALGKPHWNASAACCGEGPRSDDLGYLQGVLRDVKTHFKVDPRRIYAFAMSNGAFMAQRWACAPQGELVAVVSISGAISGPDDPPCTPTRTLSLIEVHGTADDIIRYDGLKQGTQRYPSARETVAAWVAFNHDDPKGVAVHRRSELAENIDIETWTGADSSVSLWTIHGASHFVPSARTFIDDFFALYDAHPAGTTRVGSR